MGLFPQYAGGRPPAGAVPPNATASPHAAKRLKGQARLILDRLRRGRASNADLAAVALKYTSRISDIRKAGYDVRVVSENKKTGLAEYALFENDREVR